VAYFLLSGRPPFIGKTAVQVLAAHLHEHVAPLRELKNDLPADLDEVILRCLDKHSARRFAGAEELENALAVCACASQWERERAAAWWREHEADR
jgi:serine/threonine-protein kinase